MHVHDVNAAKMTLHHHQQDMFRGLFIASFTALDTQLVSAQSLDACSGGIDAALQTLHQYHQEIKEHLLTSILPFVD